MEVLESLPPQSSYSPKRNDGSLSRKDSAFDPGADVYVCPKGATPKTTGTVREGKILLYRSSKRDCDPCPLKSKYCPRTSSRKILRDINEAAPNHARSLSGSDAYNQSAHDRKKIERLFGEAKQNQAITRLRLRALSGAKDEFRRTATVQNLKRMAELAPIPTPQPVNA